MPWDEQDCLPNEKCEHGHNRRLCLREQGYEPYAVDNGRHFYRKWFPAEVSAPKEPEFDQFVNDRGPISLVDFHLGGGKLPALNLKALHDYDSDTLRAAEGMARE